jgi:hypothetical protein
MFLEVEFLEVVSFLAEVALHNLCVSVCGDLRLTV